MLNFASDYTIGACPEILDALTKTNSTQFSGYGTDPYTAGAEEKIRKLTQDPDAKVFFLVGGTQTNSTIIAAMLHETEGVVAADTGHVAVHEAGAVEYTGHKVLTIPGKDGKMEAAVLRSYLDSFYHDENHPHMVQPGMVYISHPTEYGTLYSAEELTQLYTICQQYDIPLFVDGARLGYGLMSRDTDVTLPFLAAHCDAFYIGGTKVGALFGEAVVFPNGRTPKHFYTLTKQHGAMLAKGWLTGLQFDVLFTDELYFRLGKNAIDRAEELKALISKHGLTPALLSPTNQQFVCLPDAVYEKLKEKVIMSFWEKPDTEHTVVRFATAWHTTADDIAALDRCLTEVLG